MSFSFKAEVELLRRFEGCVLSSDSTLEVMMAALSLCAKTAVQHAVYKGVDPHEYATKTFGKVHAAYTGLDREQFDAMFASTIELARAELARMGAAPKDPDHN